MGSRILTGVGILVAGLAGAVLVILLVRRRALIISWLAETLAPGISGLFAKRRIEQHWTDEAFSKVQDRLAGDQARWYWVGLVFFASAVSVLFIVAALNDLASL